MWRFQQDMRILIKKYLETNLYIFCKNLYIFYKMSHLTPWYLFWRTVNILWFRYDFCYDYFRLRGPDSHIFIKIRIFCQKHQISTPGVLMYGLTPGVMVFFQELLIWFNLSMTFVMIIADFGVKFIYFL